VRAFLGERWFLLSVALSLVVAWVFPPALAWTGWLDPRVIVWIALFLLALGLPTPKVLRVVRNPAPALWAAFISYALLPPAAWAIGSLLPNADLRMGLFIMAAVPCTMASTALWTRRAGGDDAIALLVTVLTTATSWLVTTAWLLGMTRTTIVLDGAQMVQDLFWALVVPVALGQLLRAGPPIARLTDRFRIPLGVTGQVLILVMILKAAAPAAEQLRNSALALAELLWSAVLCLVLHLAALWFGLWSSQRLGFSRKSQIAVAFACSQKTLPVALFLFEKYFAAEYPLAVAPLLFYHVGQLVADTLIADRLKRGQFP
jgi:solute carrier family 10 (sodium/bile acid cotransporter), member 7